MPTRRTVVAVAAIATGAAAALLVAKWRDLANLPIATIGGMLFGALAFLFLADAAFTAWQLRRHPIAFERQMPSAFALGQPTGWSSRWRTKARGPGNWSCSTTRRRR